MNSNSLKFKKRLITRLRQAIKKRGLSILGLERKLGKKRGYIGDAFREQKVWSVDLIVEILEGLDIDVFDFVAGRVD